MKLLPTDPRRGASEALEAWMAEATQSEIEQLACFARGRQDDLRAIKAGLTLEWSHGVTKGHIHCLRLVKHRGHGRVGFVLSRQRILRAAQRRNVAHYI
jgi:transposase